MGTSESSGASIVADSFRDALTEPFPTVLKWIVYVVLIAAGVAVLAGVRKLWRRLPPRKGMVVGVEDLTADAAQRNSASHVLSRQLLTELRGLGSARSKPEADIDESADLDRTFLASLNLGVAGSGVAQFETLVQGEPAVSIGPVSFSIRQVAYMLASYFRRHSEFELTGALTAHGDRTVLVAERTNAKGQLVDRWYASRDASADTQELVGDIATQIVVDLGCSTATTDWRSFREYRRGLAELERSDEQSHDGRAHLEAAESALARSLEHDPLNALARFYLASMAGKRGDHEGAIRQYTLLEELIQKSTNSKTDGFFKDHAELRPIVRYNVAAALLKLPRPDHKRALGILNGLQEQLGRAASAPPFAGPSRYRFAVLVRSALAATLSLRVDHLVHASDDPANKAQRDLAVRRLVNQIEDAVKAVAPLTQDAVRSPVAYASALATAENALGSACFLVGRPADGLAAFRRAITIRPDLVEARLNLADALYNCGEFEWQRQSEATLLEVLRLEPGNARAHYLLAHLYLHGSVARRAEAEKHLDLAGSYPQALFKRGRAARAGGEAFGGDPAARPSDRPLADAELSDGRLREGRARAHTWRLDRRRAARACAGASAAPEGARCGSSLPAARGRAPGRGRGRARGGHSTCCNRGTRSGLTAASAVAARALWPARAAPSSRASRSRKAAR